MKLFETIKSVLAALFGVQSEQQRQQDFRDRSPLPYILIGIALIVLFVLSLVVFSQWLVAR